MPAYEYKVTYADGSTNNIRALESQVEELTKDGGSYEKIEVALTDGQIRNNARSWRDMELLETDYIVPLTQYMIALCGAWVFYFGLRLILLVVSYIHISLKGAAFR